MQDHAGKGARRRLYATAALIGATMALTPGTALGAGESPTSITIDSVTPVEHTLEPATITATVKSAGAPVTGRVVFRNEFNIYESTWPGQFRFLGETTCASQTDTCMVTYTPPNALLPAPNVNRIVASYAGDEVNAESRSQVVEVSGLKWTTTTPTVTPRSSTTVEGQPLEIDASLALTAPSAWRDDSWYRRTYVYAEDLDTGQRAMGIGNPATITLPGLSAGTHRIKVYWHDANIHTLPIKLPEPVVFEHVVTPAADAAPVGGGDAPAPEPAAGDAPAADGAAAPQAARSSGERPAKARARCATKRKASHRAAAKCRKHVKVTQRKRG